MDGLPIVAASLRGIKNTELVTLERVSPKFDSGPRHDEDDAENR